MHDLLGALRLDPGELLAAWRVGSRVYGTSGPESDHDFLVVRAGAARSDLHFSPGCNAIVHDRASFQASLDGASLVALEAWFAPAPHRLIEPPRGVFRLVLDRGALVASALARSERDAGAALRRFDDDPAAAHKRAFHAVRGLLFTRQLLAHGRLVDLTEGAELLPGLRACADRDALARHLDPLRRALVAEVEAAGRRRRR
ncbi:MAG: hypothetical protein EOO75_09085 [Myxococcales bacterium]|nr:MAG: hypothetical protein EOO75_09085 [Myxococcales bacterium]